MKAGAMLTLQGDLFTLSAERFYLISGIQVVRVVDLSPNFS